MPVLNQTKPIAQKPMQPQQPMQPKPVKTAPQAQNMAQYGTQQVAKARQPQQAQQPQQNPAIRGSWLGDKFKQAKNWVEENVTSKIADVANANNAGASDIKNRYEKVTNVFQHPQRTAEGVVNATKDELGRFDENYIQPVVEGAKDMFSTDSYDPNGNGSSPMINQNAVNSMTKYGNAINKQFDTFDPTQYGAGAYQTRTANPQVTQGQAAPAPKDPRYINNAPQKTQVTAGQALPQIPTSQTVSSPTAKNTASLQQVSNPAAVNAPTLNSVGSNSRVQAPVNMGRIDPKTMVTPSVPLLNYDLGQQMVSGQNNLGLQSVSGIDPNIAANRNTIQGAIDTVAGRQNDTQGFGNDYVQRSEDMATRRLDEQKAAAIQNLKEQQGAAGNLGSSVAQKQISDLMAEYDYRAMDAADTANLRQEEAAREDRYRNQAADVTNTNQLQSLAGSDYNMGMGFGDFQRTGTQIDNSSAITQANFGRQGTQIDNATNQLMSQYGNNIAQQNYGNLVNQNNTDYGRMVDANNINNNAINQDFQNRMNANNINYGRDIGEQTANNSVAQQNFGNQQAVNDTNFNRGMATTGFNNQASQQQFQNDMNVANTNFGNQMSATGFNNQAGQQDYANNLNANNINYGRNMDVAGFNNNAGQQDFQNQLTTTQFNAGQDNNQFAQQMQQYGANKENDRYQDSVINDAERFNIGQADNAEASNIRNYQSSLGDMANFGSNQVDQKAMMDYQMWKEEQDRKVKMAQAMTGVVGGLIK